LKAPQPHRNRLIIGARPHAEDADDKGGYEDGIGNEGDDVPERERSPGYEAEKFVELYVTRGE
jgi:hypothetical protein